MPIIEKIDRAKKEYTSKLEAFRKAAEEEREDTTFEKELISNARKDEYLLDAFLDDLVYNMEEL